MKNKKIIFIDNDHSKYAEKDVDYVKNALEQYFNVSSEDVEKIEIVSDFGNLKRDDAYKLMFSGDNIIATWSMYTHTHANSLGQLITFLAAAGRNDIKDIIYIDASGEITRVITNVLRNNPTHVLDIIKAIENNYIMTFEDGVGFRLRTDFTQRLKMYKQEKIDLLTLK